MQWLFLAAMASPPPVETVSWSFATPSRPPIVETSRQWVPPIRDVGSHLMDFEKATPPPIKMERIEQPKTQLFGNSEQFKTKACLCSDKCVCGCNRGLPCECPTHAGDGNRYRDPGTVAVPPLSAPNFAAPVGPVYSFPPVPQGDGAAFFSPRISLGGSFGGTSRNC